jgi:hypothetical protein
VRPAAMRTPFRSPFRWWDDVDCLQWPYSSSASTTEPTFRVHMLLRRNQCRVHLSQLLLLSANIWLTAHGASQAALSRTPEHLPTSSACAAGSEGDGVGLLEGVVKVAREKACDTRLAAINHKLDGAIHAHNHSMLTAVWAREYVFPVQQK